MADLNSELFRQLATFAFGGGGSASVSSPSDYQIALSILSNARASAKPENHWKMRSNESAIAQNRKKVDTSNESNDSTLGRIIDVIARPLYGMANVLDSELDEATKDDGKISATDVLKIGGTGLGFNLPEFWEGFSGKEKTTTRDIVDTLEKNKAPLPDAIKSGWGGFAFNLAGDIALDPLTYVPIVGPVKAGVRGASRLRGKVHPQWADTRAVKQARKAAKRNPPRLTEQTPIIPSNQAPSAFQALTRAAAQSDSQVAPDNFIPSAEQDEFGRMLNMLSPTTRKNPLPKGNAIPGAPRARGVSRPFPDGSPSTVGNVVSQNDWYRTVNRAVGDKFAPGSAPRPTPKPVVPTPESPSRSPISFPSFDRGVFSAARSQDDMVAELTERFKQARKDGTFTGTLDDFIEEQMPEMVRANVSRVVPKTAKVKKAQDKVAKSVPASVKALDNDQKAKLGQDLLEFAKAAGIKVDELPDDIDELLNVLSKMEIPGTFHGKDLIDSLIRGGAAAKALEDAPVLKGALNHLTETAGIASSRLSPQAAAMANAAAKQEARNALKAAGASQATLDTYGELASKFMFKARGPAQNAIDNNASKLTIPMGQPFKGKRSKGRFIGYGTPLPVVTKGKGRTTRSLAPSGSSNIKSQYEFSRAVGGAAAAKPKGFMPSGAPQALPTPKPTSIPTPKPKASSPVSSLAPNTPSNTLSSTSRIPQATAPAANAVSSTPRPKPITGVFGPVNTAVSNAIRNSTNISVRKLKPGETISQFNAVQGMLARFATYIGQKDLRPIALDYLGSALANASLKMRGIERMMKGFSDDEILEAWEIARGAKPEGIASRPEVVNLATSLQGRMSNHFWQRAVPERIARGNSTAFRTGMNMQDLNNALARFEIPFRFTDGIADDPITGAPVSYGNRASWLLSWETASFAKAHEFKQFLFGIESAVEQLAKEYAFIDDMAVRFGSRSKDALHNVRIVHPRLGDYYFNQEMADQFSRAIARYNEFYSPGNKVTRFVRQATSMWKTGVTIYNPRHHIANVIGDVFLAWLAGVNNPAVFKQSAKVMFANRGLYKDLASIDELTSRNAIKNAMAKPGTVVAKNKSQQEFTAQQIYTAAFNHGLLQQARVLEDIAKEGIPLPGFLRRPLGGKGHALASKASETRDHYVRLAHFIDLINKSKGKDYRQIFEDAAHEVRKWHPDGLDLTKQEQFTRTLIIPFYSWMRKSIPLLVEGAVMNPQKAFTAYPKVQMNLQEMMGIEGTTLGDPMPADQLFPSWLREDNTAVLGKPGMAGLGGFFGGLGRQKVDEETGQPIDAYVLGGPTNPMQDLFTQWGGFERPSAIRDGIMSSVNPGIRIPMEIDRGKEYFSGIPLENRYQDYATNQVPMLSQFSRMTNLTPFGGQTNRAEEYGIGNQEAFINWLLNANITGSGPYIKSAEFERQPMIKEKNKKIREFSNSELGYPLKDKGRIPDFIRQLYEQKHGGQ